MIKHKLYFLEKLNALPDFTESEFKRCKSDGIAYYKFDLIDGELVGFGFKVEKHEGETSTDAFIRLAINNGVPIKMAITHNEYIHGQVDHPTILFENVELEKTR